MSLLLTGTRRAQAGGLGALAIVLAMLTIAAPALAAAECVPTSHAFSPGRWLARGITIRSDSTDEISTMRIRGAGGFNLLVSDVGEASGSISLAGMGYGRAIGTDDGSGIDVEYVVSASLSGTGMHIEVDGTQDLTIRGAIDSNPNGQGDDYAGSGQEMRGFGNDTSREYHAGFSPSAANCNTVFGSLDGPAEYGVFGSSSESYFMAFKVAGSEPENLDLESRLVDLLEAAETLLHMDPVDQDLLYNFIRDVIAFDSVLASLEDCELVDTNAGPAWQMLRDILVQVAHSFLQSAYGGTYTTRDVIGTMAAIFQGAVLGWRGSECLETYEGDPATSLMTDFEDVLVVRLEAVLGKAGFDPEAQREVDMIAAAAYQYGMTRVLAMLEGKVDVWDEPANGAPLRRILMQVRERFVLTAAMLSVLVAACGGAGPSGSDEGSTSASGADASGAYRRPPALARLPLVELVGPAATNAGPAPVFEWRGVDSAVAYRLSVRGPEIRTWAWSGPETSVRYGGVAEGQSGPAIVPGTVWSVAALRGDGSVLALSELRPVSPTEDPGPRADWLAAVPVAPVEAPAAAPPAGEFDACHLFSADEITAAIDGTWGTPELSDYGSGNGRCEWTSGNGTVLAIDVMPADTYDPDGWGADGTVEGLGEQSYIVSHGWDRRIGFVRGGRSVTLSIDWTRVDLEAFVGIAREIEGRLP